MAERITDEQAIKIAEWLGRYYEVHDIVLIENNRGKLTSCKEWLSTAEAERALMDELGELGIYVEIRPLNKKVAEKYRYEIVLTRRDHYNLGYLVSIGNGKTRIAALHNAVLELIGEEKKDE